MAIPVWFSAPTSGLFWDMFFPKVYLAELANFAKQMKQFQQL